MERPTSPSLVAFALWFVLAAVVVSVAPVVALSIAPMSCDGCHDTPAFVEAHEQSSHASTDCLFCHTGEGVLGRVDFGVRQAYTMLIPITPTTSRDSSIRYNGRCTSCHEVLDGAITRDGISVDHATCAVGRSCTDCHGGVAHGAEAASWVTTYKMDWCLECHSAADARRNCEKCHQGKHEGDRAFEGAWAITHGPDWQRTHGMGDLDTCAACHAEEVCAKCHGAGVPHGVDFPRTHGALAQSAQGDCESCHIQDFCTDCHSGYAMPHPVGFLQQHSGIVDESGPEACLNCHTQADCDACHTAHVHPGGAIGGRGGI